MERVLHCVPPGGAHLDVGTGNGDGTALVATITRCFGVEYGPTSAAIAAANGCVVVQADARCLPFGAERFDSLTCLDVLEHIPRPAEAVGEMVRVLRTGGTLVLETPNRELLKERVLRLARALGFRQKQPYDVALSLAALEALLRRAGLTIDENRPIRSWDPHPIVRAFSWSRLFRCRKRPEPRAQEDG